MRTAFVLLSVGVALSACAPAFVERPLDLTTQGAPVDTLVHARLASVTLRSGEVVPMGGHAPAVGHTLCSHDRTPPCFSAHDVVAATAQEHFEYSAGEKVALGAMTVALLPFALVNSLEPSPPVTSWWRTQHGPCVETGEWVEPEGRRLSDAQVIEWLSDERRSLSGFCLGMLANLESDEPWALRAALTATARIRFEREACVHKTPANERTYPRWVMPRGRMDRYDESAPWPEVARSVLTDPATYEYSGLEKACAGRGGVSVDLAEAVTYARAGWPLPEPL